MKKKIFIFLILLMTIIFTVISFFFDIPIIKFIESLRNLQLDYFFLSVNFASNAFIIFLFIATIFLWSKEKRKWLFPLGLTVFLSIVLSYVIKILVKRPRPFHKGYVSVLNILFYFMKNNFNTWNFSFPSFQTVLVFSVVPIISKEFKKFRYIWFIFAILVGLSRIYFGVHYLSDVLAGAVIGYLIGYLLVLIEERYDLGLRLAQKLKIS